MTQEISELQIHLSKLNTKLSEAENAMKMLKNTKRELKDDLNVKALSLVIDRYDLAWLTDWELIISIFSYQTEMYGHQAKLSLPHSLCLLHSEGGRGSGEAG